MPGSALSSDDYRRLIRLLIQFRRDNDVTQAEAAKRLGKPQSYVSKIERCERRLDVVEFRDYVDAIGCDPLTTFEVFLDGADAA